MIRFVVLLCFILIATPGRAERAFAESFLEPRDPDIVFVAECGFIGEAFGSELGSGLFGLARLAVSNVAPEMYAGGAKLWRELKLDEIAQDALSGRLAIVVLDNRQWAVAGELDIERALGLVDRLNAKARSIDASGPILTVGDGRYVAAVRPGRALDGSDSDRVASIVIAPDASEALVKRLGRGLLGDAGVLKSGDAVDAAGVGGDAWLRLFVRLEEGVVSFSGRGNAESWDVRARVPRALIVGDRVETLSGLDRATFDRVSEGAAISVAGLADLELAGRTPILGAVVGLLPAEQSAMISDRPSMLTVRVDDGLAGERRLSLLVLVHADASRVEASAVDVAVDHAATGLGLCGAELRTGFDGFRPTAARRRIVNGPTRELLEPLTGDDPVLEWAMVRDDGWWAMRLAAGESRLQRVRADLQADGAGPDEGVLSYGLLSPAKIGATPRAGAVMPPLLSGAFSKIGEIRWQTKLSGEDLVEIEVSVSARDE